ncbi:hypothetical protein CUR178_07258 [Leishmania enriettii]|uniref:protein-tyrosine-phosphatase n=1 Tax=Leishmania enriettii TaxID=5663 RepID=A0A836HEG2_LEIEN|nr:hypothetical protein CUR178_07258 [Leishmania enriettii]
MKPTSSASDSESSTAGNVAEAPVLSDADAIRPSERTPYYYACRHCRTRLFDAAEVLPHDPKKGSNKTFKFRRGSPSHNDGALGEVSSGVLSAAELCTSLFLDPDRTPWVAKDIREAYLSGAVVEPDTIYCRNPRCRTKLGTQSWTGAQCSCGAWITPAFRIHARSVDKLLD